MVRTGIKDLVTGKTSWGPEPSWTIPVETVPAIEGYRPDVDKTFSTTLWFDHVDQGPGQSYIWEQYIQYRKIYTGSLNIIDDTTGKTLKTFETQIDEGNGPQNFTYDQNYNFNEDSAVKDYLNNGYEKVSSNYPGTLTWKADNQFEIHLKHRTDTKDRKETVSRTIHFVDQNRKTVNDDYVQTITFNLTDTVDQVTGKTLKTECSNSPQSFDEIQAPKIENMSPLDSSVPALSVEYKDGLKNLEATIHYADTRNAAISFIDDTTNKSLIEMSASGAEGSEITFEHDPDSVIQSYEAKGWKRVSSDWNNGSVYTSENKFTVHLTHNTVPYSETRTYTDECSFIDVDTNKEVADANTRSVELTGKGTLDMVTGKITWTEKPSYTFPEIDIPKVAGYKNPDWDDQPYTVTFGGSSLKTAVPYKKVYSGTLKIIDDTDKKTLETLNITDSFSNAADFGQKGLLDGYLDQGYVLVSDNSENKTLEWQPAVNAFEIHLQHKKDPVTGTKTVKRFINYVNAINEETVAPSVTQSVTLNVEGVKDAVTQETMWISDYANYAFEEVWSPKIKDMRCLTPLVKAESIVFSPELPDTTVTVRYQPENQALIDFIDDTDGSIIAYYASQGLAGKPIIWPADPQNTISSLEARGYKLVSNDWQDGKLYEENGNSHYSVHFVHNTETEKQTRTFKRTIHYVNEATGKAVLPDKIQNVQFHETGIKDLVTGKTSWTPADQQILSAVDSPEVDGMMALTKSVPALIVPDDENLKDVEATVKYRQILNAEIIYRDDTEKKDILKDTAQGSPNVKIHFKEDPAKQIQVLEDQGYQLGENNWKDGSTFSADSSNKYIVHFTHKTAEASKQETVKASYSFQDASSGNDLKDSIEKTHDLIWKGTKDLVTNEIKWDKEPSWTFEAMTAPEIEGYQPEQARFDPAVVSFSQKFADLVMDYNPVYSGTLKIIDDTTGKVLSTRTIQDSLSKTPDFGQESLLARYSEQGYELVSDGVADKKLSHNPDENSFEIHLKHKSEPLQKTKTISRTIHYVNAQTSKSVAADFSQSLTFVQNGHKDLVTGSTVWDKPQTLQFTAVKSPEIEHLRCLNPTVPVKEVAYSDDLKDSEVTVRYQPEDQAVLDFVDDDEDGKILDSFMAEGVDGQKVNFKEDPADRISELEKQNYILASNDWNDDAVFKKDETNHYQIHFTHKKEDVSKDGLYTLNVKFKDAATREEIHDEANYEHPFTVAGKKDLVNGNIEW